MSITKRILGIIAIGLFLMGIITAAIYATIGSFFVALAIQDYYQVLPWEDVNIFLYMGLIIFPCIWLFAKWLERIIHLPENQEA